MTGRNVTRLCGLAAAVLWLASALPAQPKKTGEKAKPFPNGKTKPAPKKGAPAGKTPAKTAPKKARPAAKKPPRKVDAKAIAEWESLNKRRQEIGKELLKLRDRFSIASRADKLKIKDKFETLLDEWKKQVEPKMLELSFRVLDSQPENDMALGMATESRRYEKLADLAEKLIGEGYDRQVLYSEATRANFKANRFAKAVQLFEAAAKKGEPNFNLMRLSEEAKKHVDLWKKEQELRTAEAKAPPEKQLPRVRFETNRGSIEVVLFENQAPNTVANFVSLAESKYYDGVRIHEAGVDVLTGAGGTKQDYDPKKTYEFDGPDYNIKSEYVAKDARMRFRGSLIMEHSGLINTGGSQFAFVRATPMNVNTLEPGRLSRTVFGYVVSGMDVVDSLKKGDTIKKVTVVSKRKHPYKPKTSLDKEEEGTEKKEAAKKDGAKKDGAKKDGAMKDASPGKSDAGKTKPAPTTPKAKTAAPMKKTAGEAKPKKKP